MADDRRQSCQSTSRRRWRKGWKSGDGPDKRGLNTKIHLAMDAHGMPVRFFISSGTTADCTVAAQLIEGFRAEYLLADRGYDTDTIIFKAFDMGMIPAISPRKIENICESMTNIFINSGISLRMVSCSSKDGVVLLRAIQKRCFVY